MKHPLVAFLTLATIAIFSNVTESPSASADATCKCYCRDQNWSPGAISCMAGFKYVSVARGNNGTTDCGWDPKKLGKDQIPCDGGEHCK